MIKLPETAKDLAELRSLTEAYALAMDRVDLEAFPRLFVPDGSLLVRQGGRTEPLGEFRGPGPHGIGLIARLLGDLYESTLHHVTTHEAVVEGDRAAGTTYCLAYHIANGGGRVLETLGVRYEERFVRTDEGWRFELRDATRLWSQITPLPHEPLLIDRAAARAVTKG
jgi:hypothetical protein